eukprot:1152962-Pelagomonas_calceolata.AAC.7
MQYATETGSSAGCCEAGQGPGKRQMSRNKWEMAQERGWPSPRQAPHEPERAGDAEEGKAGGRAASCRKQHKVLKPAGVDTSRRQSRCVGVDAGTACRLGADKALKLAQRMLGFQQGAQTSTRCQQGVNRSGLAWTSIWSCYRHRVVLRPTDGIGTSTGCH